MIHIKRYLPLLLTLFVAAFGVGYSLGQATATGTLQGTVSDKSGAVVGGAQVVAVFNATGVTRTASTSDSGSFRFDFVPAGTYKVTVTKQGFASLIEITELLVGQTATVTAVLSPGATTTIVEVAGVAPIVDLAKTSVSQDITPSEVALVPEPRRLAHLRRPR